MGKIILQAMKNCALIYSKGFQRWEHLWDESLTVEQKAKDISDELARMGYKITRN